MASRVYQDSDSGIGDNDSVVTDDSGYPFRKSRRDKYLIVKPLRRSFDDYDGDDESDITEVQVENQQTQRTELETHVEDQVGEATKTPEPPQEQETEDESVTDEDYIDLEIDDDDESFEDEDEMENVRRPISAHWMLVRDYFLGGEFKKAREKAMKRRPESAFYSLSRQYKLNLLLHKLQICESTFSKEIETQIRIRMRAARADPSEESVFFNYPGTALTHPEVMEAVRQTLRGNMTNMEVKIQFVPMGAIMGDMQVMNRWILTLSNPRSKAYLQMKGITVRGNHLDLNTYDRVFEDEKSRVKNIKKEKTEQFSTMIKQHEMMNFQQRKKLKNYLDLIDVIDFSSLG